MMNNNYHHTNDTHLNILNTSNMVSNDNDELYNMAKKINNEKKQKNNNDIYAKYSQHNNKLSGIGAYEDLCMTQIDKGTNNGNVNGWFTAQGEYMNCTTNNNNNNDNDNNNNNVINGNNINKLDYGNQSDLSIKLSTQDYDSSSDSSFSSDISSIYDIDNQVRKKSNYKLNNNSKRYKCVDFDVHSVDSLESLDSGESLLRHIRYCHKCKDKVIELVKKHNTQTCNKNIKTNIVTTVNNNEVMTVNNDKNNNNNNKTWMGINFNVSQMKDIITICLIGIIVIIVLDIIFQSRR